MARIAIDIDSTLHHYWDQLDAIAQRRFGVALPYAEQRTWGITALEHHQLHECVMETHTEDQILAAEPYDGAVETVRAWSRDGHWIHITSHRTPDAHGATARWLDQHAIPFDDLRCGYEKVARCVELQVDVLVDDSPVNLELAKEAGILGATLIHPWNEELIDGAHVIGADDWPSLRELLAPRLKP